MTSRVYFVDHGPSTTCRAYKGFDRNLADAPFLALAMTDGDDELYALDDLGPAVAELSRYLADDELSSRAAVSLYELRSPLVVAADLTAKGGGR